MVSVAEQFSSLRQTLGSVLGIYTLLRWLRTLYAKITGRPPPADATSLTPAAFAAFAGGSPASSMTTGPDGLPRPKPSKKPFVVFLLAVFGLPYLMSKLIRALAKSQENALQQQQGAAGTMTPYDPSAPSRALDPAKLDFCKVLYDFPPHDALANGTFDAALDLSVKKGDLVAVLDKSDPEAAAQGRDVEAEWWRCRARDGRMGYLPKVYLETITRRAAVAPAPAQIEGREAARTMSLPGSDGRGRAQTLTSERAASLTAANASAKGVPVVVVGPGEGKGKLDEFQKGSVNDR